MQTNSNDHRDERPRTGFAWDEWFMWHNTGRGGGLVLAGGWVEPHGMVDNPEPKRRLKNLMDRSGLTEQLVPIKSRPATEEELCYFHTADHVALVREGSKGMGGMAGPYVPFGADTFEIARRAAGALLETVDHVLDGKVDNAYALLYPPGHHAQAHQGLGNCIFGNVVIAAHHARRVRGVARVAIVDFDVHHGNGAQEAFYDDPSVLTISIHQRGWFTLKGEVSERGEGAGDGANINIPLPAGSGNGAFISAFERAIVPALHRFKPDLILVAAGYDAGSFDVTGRMIVTTDAFRTMSRMLIDAAATLCAGGIIFEHEGGYNPTATLFSALAVIEELSGIATGVEDPFDPLVADCPDLMLLPHQEEIIDQVVEAFGLQ